MVAVGAQAGCSMCEEFSYFEASGPIPVDLTERLWVDLVVCREGVCSEGTLDAPPGGDVETRAYGRLTGAAEVWCGLGDEGGSSTQWILSCSFGNVEGEARARDLEAGDSELVWIEVRDHSSGELLVHVEQQVTFQGNSKELDLECAYVWGSVKW